MTIHKENENDKILFFDDDKKNKINDFFNKKDLEIYVYSCVFNVKYKGIIGETIKRGTVTTNQKIVTVDDNKIVEKVYLSKHKDIEKAKLVQIIEIKHEKIKVGT